MATITDRAVEYAEKMDALAEDEFGEAYTLKVTFWGDDDFRIVAYSVKDTEMPEHEFEELWYQDQEDEFDGRAALKIRTFSAEADTPRTDTRQIQKGQGEWVPFPES